ncbi:MAG: hypothetical protein H6R02_95 [Burkholderiaceae bacterium]|jgi:hypothetical protein|nr:hypothetical protein [Burkholderiaceae bacterium]
MPAPRNPLTLAVLVSLWLAGVVVWPLWRALTEPSELSCMRGRQLSHDHLFRAVLGLMGVGRGVLKPALVLNSECRSG